MRRPALDLLACPRCLSALELRERAASGEHVTEGTLACTKCDVEYPITRGVPHLLAETRFTHEPTPARFAEEWRRYHELQPYYEQQFLDWLAPVGREHFRDRLVFEGGCGKGRHTALAAAFGARAVVAIDLGEAAEVAFANTRDLPAVHVVIGDVRHPPVRPVFDLAFSIGVLHHLGEPEAGFGGLVRTLAVGGRVATWVYGAENNGWIVRYVDPLRTGVTSRVPGELLATLSHLPAGALCAAGRTAYRWLPLPYAAYVRYIAKFPYREIHSIVYDHLTAPVAHYLPREEVARWYADAGVCEVEIRWHNENSWAATGVRAA
jgi:uncharacterized protein YbaR (Trm112 family)